MKASGTEANIRPSANWITRLEHRRVERAIRRNEWLSWALLRLREVIDRKRLRLLCEHGRLVLRRISVERLP